MKTNYDVIIIGLGPAGVSASLYTQRANVSTLIIGQTSESLSKAEKIDNYYGIDVGMSGSELFEKGVKQAESVGADIVNEQVVGISWTGDYIIKTNESEYTSKAVIIATGTKRSRPNIANVEALEGKGISYCAVCDGFFYKGKTVAVIGAGEYAHQEAKELMPLAEKVIILTDGKPALNKEGFMYDTRKISKILGETKVSGIEFEDSSNIELDGIFIAIGTAGATDLAKKIGVEINKNSIVVDEKMQTMLPGLYACGDTIGGIYQVAKAVCDGMIAGQSTIKYIRGLKND